MENESSQGIKNVNEQEEKTYPVRLRPHLVKYFKEGLTPTYSAQQEEIQRDGSYKRLTEFRNSNFSRLMNKLTIVENDDHVATNSFVSINLSKEDMSRIDHTIKAPEPTDYVGYKVHREMADELKNNFQDSKNSAMVKQGVEKAKNFFKREK